jgi:hypothetical protein
MHPALHHVKTVSWDLPAQPDPEPVARLPLRMVVAGPLAFRHGGSH